ncbi:MAG: MFS transporter [Thaumarchaeota archaeon]|nr:MFS transporter [Nitrososphaerota archaeon]
MSKITKTTEAVVVSEPVSSPRALTISRGKGVLIVLGIFVAILMGALDQFVVLTALPTIATDLSQPSGVAFVLAAYLISGTIGIPIFGRLADMYSRRSVFLVGLVRFIAGSALAGFSANLDELIAFRAVQGFSSEAFIIVGFTIVSVLFPPENRARIAGLFSGSFVIATILGPFLGSYIVDQTSWRWVFYINIPIAIAGLLILIPVLGRLVPEKATRHFDVPGTALLVGWVSTLMFALIQNSDAGWGWTDLRILGLLGASATLLLGFVYRELKTDQPVVPLRFFSRRVFAASGSVAFFRGLVLSSLLVFVAIYVGLILSHGGASTADTIRDVLYFFLIPAVLGAGAGSQVMLRVPYRALTMFGMGLAVIGTFLLSQISSATPVWQFSFGFLPTGGLVLALPLVGLGIGLTFAVTLLASQFAVSRDDFGAATGIIQFLGVLGGAIGVSILSSFQQWRIAALTPALPSQSCLGGPVSSVCSSYLQAVQNAGVVATQEIFIIVFVMMIAAFISSMFVTGHMPKSAKGMQVN